MKLSRQHRSFLPMPEKERFPDESHADTELVIAGIRFFDSGIAKAKESLARFIALLKELGLCGIVEVVHESDAENSPVRIRLNRAVIGNWISGGDTTRLCEALDLDTLACREDLEREVLAAMLAGPIPFDFPSYAELESTLRIRCNTVAAARNTALAFDTTAAERPKAFWRYAKGRGFTLLHDVSLIRALTAATQPGMLGKRYAFSCYRATEYVMLLGLTQELARCNPELLHRIETRWRIEPIMSGPFHDIFLREHGSMEESLPYKYYVPGDRVWFRNPEPISADITGYEGSWVIYLGNGLFSNFWNPDKPYSLISKCVEIFHWRHATYIDEAGELQMDEAKLADLVEASMRSPARVKLIMSRIARYRDSRGIYQDGGCIDTSREHVRWVRRETTDIDRTVAALSAPKDGNDAQRAYALEA